MGQPKPKHLNKRSPHSATKIECSQDFLKKEIKKKKERNRLTDMENKLVVTSAEKEWRSGKIEVGSSEVQTTMYEINKLQGSIV